MTRIGVIVPLPGEVRSLTRSKIATGTITPLTSSVFIGLCGMGAERASAMGECLVDRGVTGLVSWGSAASLNQTVLPGSLVVPTRVIAADGVIFEVDYQWHARLRRSLTKITTVHHRPLAHTNGLLLTAEHKRRLRATHHAIAADMESAALASVAKKYHVPFIAIRAISDHLELDLPDCVNKSMDKEGQVQPLRVLGHVAWHPAQWRALLQLGCGFRSAQKTLENVVRHTGPTLLGPTTIKHTPNVADISKIEYGINAKGIQ